MIHAITILYTYYTTDRNQRDEVLNPRKKKAMIADAIVMGALIIIPVVGEKLGIIEMIARKMGQR